MYEDWFTNRQDSCGGNTFHAVGQLAPAALCAGGRDHRSLECGKYEENVIKNGVGTDHLFGDRYWVGLCLLQCFGVSSFGIYLLLFIPISAALKLTDGIVVNSVLMTHFLIEQSFASALILNEFLLMLIGVGFALLFNLYMPDLQKHLQEDQLVIDVQFKRLLEKMAQNINRPQQHDLLAVCNNLLDYIREAQKKAEIHSANQWVGENDYFEEYFTMRRAQLRLLNDLIALLDTIAVEDDFVMAIRELIQETAATFGEANDGQALLQRILAVYESYRLSPLPQSREEFENRARLFQFLQTFTNFIEIKAEFANEKKLEIG